jgi:hypothetical protein
VGLVLFVGTADFFGLNHYTTMLVMAGAAGESPSLFRDIGAIVYPDPEWPSSASAWLKVRQDTGIHKK